MLVLSRKIDEGIWLGDDVLVTVLSVEHGRVKVGIKAPGDVHILRKELRAGANTEGQAGHSAPEGTIKPPQGHAPGGQERG